MITLEELMAADEKVKMNMGQKMYQKLLSLYCDQYGADASKVVAGMETPNEALLQQ